MVNDEAADATGRVFFLQDGKTFGSVPFSARARSATVVELVVDRGGFAVDGIPDSWVPRLVRG